MTAVIAWLLAAVVIVMASGTDHAWLIGPSLLVAVCVTVWWAAGEEEGGQQK